MADRPIIFSAPMVRALMEGKKTQTRRVLRPQPDTTSDPSGLGEWGAVNRYDYWRPAAEVRPYQVGDRLYVREAFAISADNPHCDLSAAYPDQLVFYRATDDDEFTIPPRWRPSIHMPRWASRLTLTVTDVRVQRLWQITNNDAVAEGIKPQYQQPEQNEGAILGWGYDGIDGYGPGASKAAFSLLWDHINGPGAWDANPWVVALTFTVQRGNIDQIGSANG